MSFDFLKNIKLEDNKTVIPTKERGKRSTMLVNPTGLRIRLFKDGRVFPSAELIEKFDLEFRSKDSDTKGNGFDVVRTDKYANYPQTGYPHVILVAATKRELGKVDLFASCNYVTEKTLEKNPELVLGAPMSSVLEQGTATFGLTELIPMLKEIYGFEFTEDQKFVDLEIDTETVLSTSDGIYFLPKLITRGKDAGKLEMQRRENIQLMPLSIVAEAAETVSADNAEENIEVAVEA